jgi:Trp operon repressor
VKGDLPNISPSLTTALTDRYRIERELGQGSMARRSVAKATASAADRPTKDSQHTTGA